MLLAISNAADALDGCISLDGLMSDLTDSLWCYVDADLFNVSVHTQSIRIESERIQR